MARPRNCRYVERKPHVTYFKPRGIPMTELTETLLTVEGLEALRLADLEGLTTGEGAERMRVSRHTFGRTLAEARRAVADALVNGRALCIEGGTYAVLPPQPEADKPHKEFHMQKVAVSSEGPSLGGPALRAGGRFRHRESRDDGNVLPRQRGLPDHGAGRGH